MHHRSRLLSFISRQGVLRRLIFDVAGSNAIEFAFAAIPLFLFLLGAMDFARLYWTQSALQFAAEAAARCATVNCCSGGPSSCGGGTGTTGLQQFAANQLLGLSAASSDLSNFALTSQACGNQVTFNYAYNFIVGRLFSRSGITLTGSACAQG